MVLPKNTAKINAANAPDSLPYADWLGQQVESTNSIRTGYPPSGNLPLPDMLGGRRYC